MKRVRTEPFTIIQGGLHPDEKSTKPAKKEKYSPYQLQLITRLRREIRADGVAHAERFWATETAKNKAHSSGQM